MEPEHLKKCFPYLGFNFYVLPSPLSLCESFSVFLHLPLALQPDRGYLQERQLLLMMNDSSREGHLDRKDIGVERRKSW